MKICSNCGSKKIIGDITSGYKCESCFTVFAPLVCFYCNEPNYSPEGCSCLNESKAIRKTNYRKLIFERTKCCFCGKKDVGLLFSIPYVFVFCRNTNCSPSYRWIQKIPIEDLSVFEIIPRKEQE